MKKHKGLRKVMFLTQSFAKGLICVVSGNYEISTPIRALDRHRPRV